MAAGTSHDPAGELVVTRVFDAPRELVFEVWTQRDHVMRWFRPLGAEMPFCELDARAGGLIHFCHAFEDGSKLWAKGRFVKVVAPECLVFALGFVDAAGQRTQHPWIPEWPLDALIETTVLLTQVEAGTEVSVYQRVTPEALAALNAIARERRQARAGWSEVMDRLAAHLASKR